MTKYCQSCRSTKRFILLDRRWDNFFLFANQTGMVADERLSVNQVAHSV